MYMQDLLDAFDSEEESMPQSSSFGNRHPYLPKVSPSEGDNDVMKAFEKKMHERPQPIADAVVVADDAPEDKQQCQTPIVPEESSIRRPTLHPYLSGKLPLKSEDDTESEFIPDQKRVAAISMDSTHSDATCVEGHEQLGMSILARYGSKPQYNISDIPAASQKQLMADPVALPTAEDDVIWDATETTRFEYHFDSDCLKDIDLQKSFADFTGGSVMPNPTNAKLIHGQSLIMGRGYFRLDSGLTVQAALS
jgi:hypothetical protein